MINNVIRFLGGIAIAFILTQIDLFVLVEMLVDMLSRAIWGLQQQYPEYAHIIPPAVALGVCLISCFFLWRSEL
ncbi:MAG: hypothetical protein ACFB2X_15050 [Rivularia sp. (in: cyanobacteria)]